MRLNDINHTIAVDQNLKAHITRQIDAHRQRLALLKKLASSQLDITLAYQQVIHALKNHIADVQDDVWDTEASDFTPAFVYFANDSCAVAFRTITLKGYVTYDDIAQAIKTLDVPYALTPRTDDPETVQLHLPRERPGADLIEFTFRPADKLAAIPGHKEIIETLMRRDGLSEDDAWEELRIASETIVAEDDNPREALRNFFSL